MTKETGTLEELGVKAGDVVECVNSAGEFTPGSEYTITRDGWIVDDGYNPWYPDRIFPYPVGSDFRIISRADNTPKPWRDMTPEEKAAIWLGFYQGRVIQWSMPDREWMDDKFFRPDNTVHDDDICYRIKPDPVRETVTLYGDSAKGNNRNWGFSTYRIGPEKYTITFDLIDGKPDPESIRMFAID